jgi:hypothetical protein
VINTQRLTDASAVIRSLSEAPHGSVGQCPGLVKGIGAATGLGTVLRNSETVSPQKEQKKTEDPTSWVRHSIRTIITANKKASPLTQQPPAVLHFIVAKRGNFNACRRVVCDCTMGYTLEQFRNHYLV